VAPLRLLAAALPCAPARFMHSTSSRPLMMRNVTGGIVGQPPPPPPRPGSNTAAPAEEPSQQQPPFEQPFEQPNEQPRQSSPFGSEQQQQQQYQQDQSQYGSQGTGSSGTPPPPPPPNPEAIRRELVASVFRALVLSFVTVYTIVMPAQIYQMLRSSAEMPLEERMRKRAVAIEAARQRGVDFSNGKYVLGLQRDTAAKVALLRAQMGVPIDETLRDEEAAAELLSSTRKELRTAYLTTIAFYVLMVRAQYFMLENLQAPAVATGNQTIQPPKTRTRDEDSMSDDDAWKEEDTKQ